MRRGAYITASGSWPRIEPLSNILCWYLLALYVIIEAINLRLGVEGMMKIYDDDNELVGTMEAAKILGLSYWFLIHDRKNKRRVPFMVLGERAYRYRVGDLKEYMRHCTKGGMAEVATA